MDKRNIVMIIIIAFVVTFFVVFRSIFSNPTVELDTEISLEAGKMISVRNDDMTRIKLVSINEECADSEKCDIGNKSISYSLLVNGKDYSIDGIPYSIDLRNNYIIDATEGDEDHLVIKVVKK